MRYGKTLGYVAYPLLTFSFLAGVQLFAQSAPDPAAAQQTEPAATQQTDPAATQQTQPAATQQTEPEPQAAPAAAPPASQSNAPSYPNEQDRLRLAREAQARVRARRQQRIQAIIQDTYSHKYEVSLGYAYLRLRPGHSLQHTTETGWNVDLTEYIRPKLGITADLRGYYSNAYVGNNEYVLFKPFISNYSAMGGPQYRFYQGRNWAVSGHILAGVSRNLFDGDSNGFPGTLLGLYPNQFRFTAAVGVPVDYSVSPALAIRVTPTYYVTTFGGETQNNRGFTLGALYRFGRR